MHSWSRSGSGLVLFYTPGTFAEDALRHIMNLEQNTTLDDVINIYENLCTVVFNTVSVYSVWFVVHWFSVGAGVVLSVIYISKEFLERNKYGTPTLNLVYLGLFFVCHVYLFLLPCMLAAMITNSCSGKENLEINSLLQSTATKLLSQSLSNG